VSKVHCGSAFEPGASRLPYYCTPRVCVPDVIGALAVWWHNNKGKKICCQDGCFMVRQRRIAEEYFSHNFDEHYLEDTRLTWYLSYPHGGSPFPGRYYVTFLGN